MPRSNTEGEEDVRAIAAQRKAAARAALDLQAKAPKRDAVDIKITKFGADLVSTGQHVAGVGDLTHDAGDIVKGIGRANAEALERKGFAEIQEPASRL